MTVDPDPRQETQPSSPSGTQPAKAAPEAHAADEEHPGDSLPDDLDVTAYVGQYTFPDIRRRRGPGLLYLVLATGCFALWVTVGFAVGHASAQLGWRGLRSRPTWRILLYSSEEPPTRRGIVLVDGVDGEVLAQFTEDNPEDWSQYD